MRRPTDVTDMILKGCILALAALLPVFFIPVSWATVQQSKVLLVSFVLLTAVLAWAWARYQDRRLAVPQSLLLFAALLLPISYALSALFSGAGTSAFVSGTGEADTVALMSMLFGIMMLVVVAYDDAETATIELVRALMAGVSALMVVQLVHLFVPALPIGAQSGSAVSAFGTWHELGIMAGLAVFLPFALWRTRIMESSWRYLGIAAGALSAPLIFIVNMRDIWYLLAALFIAFALYGWYRSGEWYRSRLPDHRTIAMLLAGLICVVGGLATSALYSQMPAKLQVMQTEVRPSWHATFAIGVKELSSARTLLFGTGPNTFDRAWNLYKPQGVNESTFWDVDFNAGVGFIPTAFATVGLIGAVAWLLFFASLVRAAVLRSLRDTFDGGAITTVLAVACYLAVFHMVYTPSFALSAIFFLILGIIAAHETGALLGAPFRGSVRESVKALAVTGVCLALVLCCAYTVRASISDLLLNKSATTYARTGDIGSALSLVRRSLALYPDNDLAHRAAVQLGMLQMQKVIASNDPSTTAQLQATLTATIRHGLEAVRIGSGDYQNWLALADLYQALGGAGLAGAYDNARAAYEEARADNPLNPTPLVRLAQIAAAEHQSTRALDLLSKALALKPDFAAAFSLRSQVQASAGNYTAAESDARQAVSLAQNDAGLWYGLAAILYSEGSYADAAVAAKNAVALESEYADALYVLGLSSERLGKHDDALQALERLLVLTPGNATLEKQIEGIRAGRDIFTTTSTATKK